MLIKHQRREPVAPQHARDPEAFDAGTGRCPGLETVLHSILRRPRPAILDLGPMCGATVTYLASLGARVTVAQWEPPRVARGSGQRTIVLDYPDHAFDMVLAWEQLDFTHPEWLDDLAVEFERVLVVGGWLYLLSLQRNEITRDRRARYRVEAIDRATREPLDEAPRSRWPHSSRTLQRSLSGFCIEGVHLWRNQVREMVATRKAIDGANISGPPLNGRRAGGSRAD